ncbi:hypothetical protein O181_011719 [Austropuccinia psidii MF-1]|uniref:Uncharacterized protein n=1 Tax=Austropuccinia psidii MF-1 TaxID=1389203 RepID=A0A9Q3BTB0_9BASI|nr:hypothetical protein [Austropuccinia psidii MF-1]
MEKTVKTLQVGHAQLSKASEETNKRLNIFFEEQHHSKSDRDCLDKDINKFCNVYHSMKPQPQGNVMNNRYHQDDIKPDAMLMNRATSPSQYQYGDNMSSLEKEALKQAQRKSCRSGKEEKFLSQLWFNRPLCQQLSKGKEKNLCH